MNALSLSLLVLFILCGLIYGRASKELMRLDKIRLETDPPAAPSDMLGAATDFARRMGIPLAPGGDELKNFCDRHGLADQYARANRRLYGSIVVAILCAFIVIKFGAPKTALP